MKSARNICLNGYFEVNYTSRIVHLVAFLQIDRGAKYSWDKREKKFTCLPSSNSPRKRFVCGVEKVEFMHDLESFTRNRALCHFVKRDILWIANWERATGQKNVDFHCRVII